MGLCPWRFESSLRHHYSQIVFWSKCLRDATVVWTLYRSISVGSVRGASRIFVLVYGPVTGVETYILFGDTCHRKSPGLQYMKWNSRSVF